VFIANGKIQKEKDVNTGMNKSRMIGRDAVKKSMSITHSGVNLEINTIFRERSNDIIVFLHGLGCSTVSFDEAWDCPELDAYSVLCLDYTGHGTSSASDEFSCSIDDHARVCALVLDTYRNRPLHLVGHSLGGAVALLLPDSIQDSIVTFANVEGNLNPEDCVFGSRRAAEKSFNEFLEEVLPEFHKSSRTWRETGLDLVNPKAFYRTAKSLVEWSDDSKLLNVFHSWPGKKAYFYGSKNSEHHTVGSVEGIARIEISNAGHFVMNDNPDEFYSALLRFIE